MRVATDNKLLKAVNIINSCIKEVEPELAKVLKDYQANIKNKNHITIIF